MSDEPEFPDTRPPGGGDESSVPTGGIPGVGDEIAGFRLESVAGSGGMGVVYRALEPELGRTVALKIISPERALDPASRALFAKEAASAAAIEHPNVLPVYRSGTTDDGYAFIAMRFVNGPTLRALLSREERLSIGRSATVVAQVAEALAAAHAAGLIHRDVKPSNILIADAPGTELAYLADFGISAVAGARGTRGHTVGTPGYVAPEVAAGGDPGPAADVYALGRVLVECLTGTPDGPAPRGLPQRLQAALAAALSAEPGDRPRAGEFAAAVASARHDVVLVHHPDDTPTAQAVAAELAKEGLDVVVTAADRPEPLQATTACALLVGRARIGTWARESIRAIEEIAARDPGFRRLVVGLPGAPPLHDRSLDAVSGWPGLRLQAAVSQEEVVGALAREFAPKTTARVGGGPDTCPYPGLDSYDESTSGLFAGREDEVAELVERLGSSRFVAVVAPSGYGKSSVLLAGLIPAIRRGALPGSDTWSIVATTPGTAPIARIAAAIGDIPGARGIEADELRTTVASLDDAIPDGSRCLLVIDQFEELFTLCSDVEERRAAVDALVHAATIPDGGLTVVIGMRADFYPRLADHAGLRALVADNQLLLGPLGGPALERAILDPARSAGLSIEPALLRTVVEDIADRPGGLPLMSHVLAEVWQRRHGRELTAAAYAAAGGIEGALAKRAEETYSRLGPAEQDLARHMLLRLVTPGEGIEDTRNRAPVGELIPAGAGEAEARRVLDALTGARLVTVSADASGESSAELAHEAVIRSWPRLREWIDESRDDLRHRAQLARSAAEWRAGTDDGLLLRGARLATWTERGQEGLSESERAFLAASTEHAMGAERARRRRTRVAVSSLSAGVVALAGIALFAQNQRSDAETARDEARSREVASRAREELPADPELSLLLARRATAIRDTPDAEAILRQAAFQSPTRQRHQSGGSGFSSVAVSADGKTTAAFDLDGGIDRWRSDTGVALPGLTGHAAGTDDDARGVVRALSGGGWLSAGADGVLRVWTPDGTPQVIARGKPFSALTVSRDGRLWATGDVTGRLRVYDSASRRVLWTQGVGDERIRAIAISPSDGQVAVGGAQRLVLVPAGGGAPTVALTTQADESVSGLDYSPDGDRLAIGTSSGSVLVRTLRGGDDVLLRGHMNSVGSVRFDATGTLLATTGALDYSVRVWRTSGGAALAVLTGHQAAVADADFIDGDRVVSAASDGTARVWEWRAGSPHTTVVPGDIGLSLGGVVITPDGDRAYAVRSDGAVLEIDSASGANRVVATHPEGASYADISPDGRLGTFAAADGTIAVRELNRAAKVVHRFDGLKGDPAAGLIPTPDASQVAVLTEGGRLLIRDFERSTTTEFDAKEVAGGFSMDMTPDGEVLATTGGDDGTTRIWRRGRVKPTATLTATGAVQNAVALSPRGPLVASGGDARTVQVWNRDTEELQANLVGHTGAIFGLRFSPDGSRLMSQGNDGAIVWDTVSWRQLLRLRRPQAFAGGFANDGRMVTASLAAATSSDYAIQVWRCDVCGTSDSARDIAAKRTTRALTPDEEALFLGGRDDG